MEKEDNVRPEERENRRYTNGSQNPIKEEELIQKDIKQISKNTFNPLESLKLLNNVSNEKTFINFFKG